MSKNPKTILLLVAVLGIIFCSMFVFYNIIYYKTDQSLFEKYDNNPILPYKNLLAENIVYDNNTGKYYMVFSNFNNQSIGLAYSTDLENWTLYEDNPILIVGHGGDGGDVGAPHLLYNDSYYLYYRGMDTDYTHGKIGVATSSNVTGPYTRYSNNPIIENGPDGSWDNFRVEEPHVLKDDDGTWIMLYMGDAGALTEQVGYATSSSPVGHWTKYPLNPVLTFGPPDSYDYGTVADPYVYKQDDIYFIFYSCSNTKHHPWRIAYATSTDLINFTKRGIALDLGPLFSWDHENAHRGAATRFGSYIYLSYTGWPYRLGMAKMKVSELEKLAKNYYLDELGKESKYGNN